MKSIDRIIMNIPVTKRDTPLVEVKGETKVTELPLSVIGGRKVGTGTIVGVEVGTGVDVGTGVIVGDILGRLGEVSVTACAFALGMSAVFPSRGVPKN